MNMPDKLFIYDEGDESTEWVGYETKIYPDDPQNSGEYIKADIVEKMLVEQREEMANKLAALGINLDYLLSIVEKQHNARIEE